MNQITAKIWRSCRIPSGFQYRSPADLDRKRGKGSYLHDRKSPCAGVSYVLKLPCVHEKKQYLLIDKERGEQLIYTAEELAAGIEITMPKRLDRI